MPLLPYLSGKDYQELRVQKRERRQPGTIPNLPYLHWEHTGQPPAGPYSVSSDLNPFSVFSVSKKIHLYFVFLTSNAAMKM